MLERTLLGQVSGWKERPWPAGHGNRPLIGRAAWPAGFGNRAWWACAVCSGELINWRRVQPKPWPEGFGGP